MNSRWRLIIWGLIAVTWPWQLLARENVPVFALSPAKQEIKVAAGDSVIRNIYITNRLGHDAEFSITIEDVSAGTDAVVKSYGRSLGPYSLKKFAMAGNEKIKVAQGEVKVVPIMISVPVRAKPGGYYGAVYVEENRPVSAATHVNTRAGSLIFLRVAGDVVERGKLKYFLSSARVFWNFHPIEFQISYENSGNVHLNPYGLIEIADWRGRVVDKIPVEPWFVYPDSTRTRGISWPSPRAGWFTANLYLNYGYARPTAETTKIHLLVVPWWAIGLCLAGLGLLAAGYKWRRKFIKWQI